MATNNVVDTDLYSRQIYAMGLGAIQRMVNSTIVFLGCGGPAVETAKNVVLSGVGQVVLIDDTVVQWTDLSANCFATEADVGVRSRSAVALDGLSVLNPTVKVRVAKDDSQINLKAFADYVTDVLQATVLVRGTTRGISDVDIALNAILRRKGVKTVVINTAGVFAELINDFGDSFVVTDPGGEDPSKHYVTAAKLNAEDGIVELTIEREHDEEDTLYTNFNATFIAATTASASTATVGSGAVGEDGAAAAPGALAQGRAFPIVDRDTVISKVAGESSKVIVKVNVGDAEDVVRAFANYTGGVYVASVVKPVTQTFVSIGEAIAAKEPRVVCNFTFDDTLSGALFRALDCFVGAGDGALPKPHDVDDIKRFIDILREAKGADFVTTGSDNLKWATLFAATASAQIGPFAAFVGGFAAQEILKAVSGKFISVEQIRYLDARNVIPEGTPKDVAPQNNRYDGQVAMFGKANCAKLLDASVFVIGAGAIGCEYLKNLALSGIGAGRAGKVCVTDNDSIEKSNLSRQFLFRNEHIGQPKSQVAAAAVKKINPQIKIRALTEKVCDETSDPETGVFNDRFWSQLSCICTAVDNNKARQFLDDMAVRYRRPMIDSGTLGPLGHVEVVVPLERPRLRDAGAEGDDGRKIPFCTLHFFPSNINHCIQYARDLFESLFSLSAHDANKFLEAPDFATFAAELQAGAKLGALEALHDTLVVDRPHSARDCVEWARRLFENVFVNSVRDVLFSYPEDHAEDGKPFWSGARKLPHVIPWQGATNATHLDLVYFAARLRAEMFNIDFSSISKRDVLDIASATALVAYSPKKMVIEDASKKAAEKKGEDGETSAADTARMREREARVAFLSDVLASFHAKHGSNPMPPLRLHAFEKDDPTNGHMDIITAISNTRAAIYGIPPEDILLTKKIAGRIIPAMITTTAAVTGFAALQLFPILLGRASTCVNYSVSLQDPSLCQDSDGNPPRSKPYLQPVATAVDPALAAKFPLLSQAFTSWDRFELVVPYDLEMNGVCELFAAKYPGLRVVGLVEERSAKWVYNAETDAAGIGLKYPLALWTRNLLGKGGIAEAGDFYIDYVVQCEVCPELRGVATLADGLPVLRYVVSLKRAKAAQ